MKRENTGNGRLKTFQSPKTITDAHARQRVSRVAPTRHKQHI